MNAISTGSYEIRHAVKQLGKKGETIQVISVHGEYATVLNAKGQKVTVRTGMISSQCKWQGLDD